MSKIRKIVFFFFCMNHCCCLCLCFFFISARCKVCFLGLVQSYSHYSAISQRLVSFYCHVSSFHMITIRGVHYFKISRHLKFALQPDKNMTLYLWLGRSISIWYLFKVLTEIKWVSTCLQSNDICNWYFLHLEFENRTITPDLILM